MRWAKYLPQTTKNKTMELMIHGFLPVNRYYYVWFQCTNTESITITMSKETNSETQRQSQVKQQTDKAGKQRRKK